MEHSFRKQSLILPVQGLRAVGFLGIFLSHTGIKWFAPLGPWGVSIFLILSGYLLTLRYYDVEISQNNFLFSIKKIKKLYCLHIITMIFALPISIYENQTRLPLLFANLLSNVLLIQAFIPFSEIYFSLNAVAWYLSVCFFIYFCFPWIIKLLKSHKHNVQLTKNRILICFIFQVILGYLSSKVLTNNNGEYVKWFVYIFPVMRLFDFIEGCLFAKIFIDTNYSYTKIKTIIVFLISCCLVFMCLVYLKVNPIDGDLNHPELWWRYGCIFSIPNGILIFHLATQDDKLCKLLSAKFLVWIGGISSYTFLIHQLVIRYFLYIKLLLGLRSSIVLKVIEIAVCLILTFTFAILYRNIENRLYKIKKS